MSALDLIAQYAAENPGMRLDVNEKGLARIQRELFDELLIEAKALQARAEAAEAKAAKLFGETTRLRRKVLGLSMGDLAIGAGIPVGRISDIERGSGASDVEAEAITRALIDARPVLYEADE